MAKSSASPASAKPGRAKSSAEAAGATAESGQQDAAAGVASVAEPIQEGMQSQPGASEAAPSLDGSVNGPAVPVQTLTVEPGGAEKDGAQVALKAALVNASNAKHRILKAGVSLAPGESQVITFRDMAHQSACLRHVAQIRALYRWPEGEGLHWRKPE